MSLFFIGHDVALAFFGWGFGTEAGLIVGKGYRQILESLEANSAQSHLCFLVISFYAYQISV